MQSGGRFSRAEFADVCSDGQDVLEHDLMQFTDSSNHESTLHIFGGSEVVGSVDVGVASTAEVVEGLADDRQNVLDMILCGHHLAGAGF